MTGFRGLVRQTSNMKTSLWCIGVRDENLSPFPDVLHAKCMFTFLIFLQCAWNVCYCKLYAVTVMLLHTTFIYVYCIHLCSFGLLSCGGWVVIWRRLSRPWKKVIKKNKWNNLWDIMQIQFISYQWKSPEGKCLYLYWVGSRSIMLCWREITPNNRVGLCYSIVYIAHGMGTFFGTLCNRWNPKTLFPLCYVMHGLLRLPLILFTLPSPCSRQPA